MITRSIESIPTWSLNYIVNGDATGLSDEELKLIKDTLKENGVMDIFPAPESQEYFTPYPWFGLPCSCEDCTVLMETTINE